MLLQETGLEQEANDAAARVAGVGGDREDRYNLNCTAALRTWLDAETQTMVLQHNSIPTSITDLCIYLDVDCSESIHTINSPNHMPGATTDSLWQVQGVAGSCSSRR